MRQSEKGSPEMCALNVVSTFEESATSVNSAGRTCMRGVLLARRERWVWGIDAYI